MVRPIRFRRFALLPPTWVSPTFPRGTTTTHTARSRKPTVALSPLFLDTAYVHGLLNTRDRYHALALAWESRLTRDKRSLVTTEYVLFEIGDALSTIRFRNQVALVTDALRKSPFVEIVPATSS